MLNDWIKLSMDAWLFAAGALSSPMDAQACDALIKGATALQDAGQKQFQTGCRSAFQLCRECSKELGKLADSGAASRFEDVSRGILKKWMDYYEKEVRPVLNVPQLGLARSYQEKLNQAIDRSNLFQASLAEFLQLLFVPLRESIRAVQDELDQQAKEGNLSEDLKDRYQKWIKTLEANYMDLFQSQSYLQSLHQVLNSAEEFKNARDSILADALKILPIPTNRDMDELYKEIYHLKKKVQELAQREMPECYLMHSEGGRA